MKMSDGIVEASIEVEVSFNELDPMGVVWHGNYLAYLERARSALLTKIGYDYEEMVASGFAWPIVDARMKFVRSARLRDRLEISVRLLEYENRLRIRYEIRCAGERVFKGETVQVAVNMETGEMCFQSPPILGERIAEATTCDS
jgi:acyl-CoA thioester hydrolase